MTQTPDDAGFRSEKSATPPPSWDFAPAPQSHHNAVQPSTADIGEIRGTGTCILLSIVTLGIYSWFWYHNTHAEMQRHRHTGIGGGVALLLAIFVPFVMLFITPSEVGAMYTARGQKAPVSGVTGCWIFLPIVGGIVWFVKTNGALNDYWRSLGAA